MSWLEKLNQIEKDFQAAKFTAVPPPPTVQTPEHTAQIPNGLDSDGWISCRDTPAVDATAAARKISEKVDGMCFPTTVKRNTDLHQLVWAPYYYCQDQYFCAAVRNKWEIMGQQIEEPQENQVVVEVFHMLKKRDTQLHRFLIVEEKKIRLFNGNRRVLKYPIDTKQGYENESSAESWDMNLMDKMRRALERRGLTKAQGDEVFHRIETTANEYLRQALADSRASTMVDVDDDEAEYDTYTPEEVAVPKVNFMDYAPTALALRRTQTLSVGDWISWTSKVLKNKILYTEITGFTDDAHRPFTLRNDEALTSDYMIQKCDLCAPRQCGRPVRETDLIFVVDNGGNRRPKGGDTLFVREFQRLDADGTVLYQPPPIQSAAAIAAAKHAAHKAAKQAKKAAVSKPKEGDEVIIVHSQEKACDYWLDANNGAELSPSKRGRGRPRKDATPCSSQESAKPYSRPRPEGCRSSTRITMSQSPINLRAEEQEEELPAPTTKPRSVTSSLLARTNAIERAQPAAKLNTNKQLATAHVTPVEQVSVRETRSQSSRGDSVDGLFSDSDREARKASVHVGAAPATSFSSMDDDEVQVVPPPAVTPKATGVSSRSQGTRSASAEGSGRGWTAPAGAAAASAVKTSAARQAPLSAAKFKAHFEEFVECALSSDNELDSPVAAVAARAITSAQKGLLTSGLTTRDMTGTAAESSAQSGVGRKRVRPPCAFDKSADGVTAPASSLVAASRSVPALQWIDCGEPSTVAQNSDMFRRTRVKA